MYLGGNLHLGTWNRPVLHPWLLLFDKLLAMKRTVRTGRRMQLRCSTPVMVTWMALCHLFVKTGSKRKDRAIHITRMILGGVGHIFGIRWYYIYIQIVSICCFLTRDCQTSGDDHLALEPLLTPLAEAIEAGIGRHRRLKDLTDSCFFCLFTFVCLRPKHNNYQHMLEVSIFAMCRFG